MFQATLLEHARHPRCTQRLLQPTHQLHAVNSLCGDELWIDLHIDQQQAVIRGAFASKGCALCRASASILLATIDGMPLRDASVLIQELLAFFNVQSSTAAIAEAPALLNPPADLEVCDGYSHWPGDVRSLLDLKAYPARARCVTLAWECVQGAITASKKES